MKSSRLLTTLIALSTATAIHAAPPSGNGLCIRFQTGLGSPSLDVVDNGTGDRNPATGIIGLDGLYFGYEVVGTLQPDPATCFGLRFTSATISRFLPGSERLLISYSSGQIGPCAPGITLSATVQGTGTGAGAMDIGASAQAWGRGEFSDIAFARRPAGQSATWAFSTTSGAKLIGGTITSIVGYLDLFIEETGSTITLPNSSHAYAGEPLGAPPARQWTEEDGGNGNYYALVRLGGDFVSWTDAREAASDMEYFGLRGHLVTVTSMAENDFVAELVSGALLEVPEEDRPVEVWLGGFQATPGLEPDEGWEWVTGEEWTTENWWPGEPNDWDGTEEDYLGMWVPDEFLGFWNDDVNESENTRGWYVVEWEADSPEISHDVAEWIDDDGKRHFYAVVASDDAISSWVEARDAAASLDFLGLQGHLATVRSPGESSFLVELLEDLLSFHELPPVEVWLGGHQPNPGLDADEGWEWVTGEEWDYTNWAPGEPNDYLGADEDYLGMWIADGFEGLWNDDVLNSENTHGWYIVEWDDFETPPPEPANVFMRGDCDGNKRVELTDAICIIDILFIAPRPHDCPEAKDGNDDGSVNITDPIYILNYLYMGGPPPPPPFPDCGEDPYPEEGLGCERTSCE